MPESPATLPNFAAAIAVPMLIHRFGNGCLLVVGLSLSLIGLTWLSGVSADTEYLTGVALPMVLIGIGHGFSLSPLTISGKRAAAPAATLQCMAKTTPARRQQALSLRQGWSGPVAPFLQQSWQQ